jgi:hypothetical protein
MKTIGLAALRTVPGLRLVDTPVFAHNGKPYHVRLRKFPSWAIASEFLQTNSKNIACYAANEEDREIEGPQRPKHISEEAWAEAERASPLRDVVAIRYATLT